MIIIMNFTTIERHFINNIDTSENFNTDIAKILYDINVAAKLIRQQVIRAGLSDSISGPSGNVNASGEASQALDMYANDIIKDVLSSHKRFSFMGSEEEDSIFKTETYETSDYVILFDPLDGSSNIDVNVSVGTIFSIYKKNPNATCFEDHCFQKGTEQIVSGYVIYGSSVMMVYTSGDGVHGFTYDPTIGEFLLSHHNITIPNNAMYYSINEALYPKCSEPTQHYIQHLKSQSLSLRYVGALVADFHRNLLKGGVYIYPATHGASHGKLRLLYEANPLAFICEQAGGFASNGSERILDIQPTELHQRVPLYIGSKELAPHATTPV
jgi:fructose-1,6-bisphosphatase I